MTWVRLDDGFAGHPKMEAVGPLAGWLHVAALCYCAQYLTDGRIPKTKALKLTDVPKPRTQIARLLAEGVWDEDGDSYVIHDYLVYQPSREKVMAERDAAARRQRRSRQRHGVTDTVTDDVTDDVSHTVSHTTPSRPDPTPVATTGLESLVFSAAGVERDPRVVAALRWLAEGDVQDRVANGNHVGDPERYRAACLRSRIDNDGAELDAIAAELPGLTADELRTELDNRRYLA